MSTLGKLAALTVLLALIALGTGAAYTESAETNTVTNETIVVDYSESTPVDAVGDAVSFNDTVTVYNSTDVLLTNETDYTWHPANGSVSWHDTANTVDSEGATISYEYDAPSQQTDDIAGVLRIGLWMSGVGLLVFGGFTALGWLDIGGGR